MAYFSSIDILKQESGVALPNYFCDNAQKRIKELGEQHPTPFLAIDLTVIEKRYLQLRHRFPDAEIFYAVKANPADEIIEVLVNQGCCFDLASPRELDKVLSLGCHPSKLSYGNTIKKSEHIKYFYDKGVRLFATDAEADLRNIAQYAPASDVFIRILFDGSESADWPLSQKFGCDDDMAVKLALLAKQLGLNPCGISFHVGSQQRDVETWKHAIGQVKQIFDTLLESGIALDTINIGGGLPANYLQKTDDVNNYSGHINTSIKEFFPNKLPRIIIEPGRSLVADSGILVSEVVLVSKKTEHADERWVYTDVGTFNGLIETLGEAIKYKILTEKTGAKKPVILAGPTCDSMDVMYEKQRYELPLSLEAGDRIYWLSTGAYTTSYSSVDFNGFPPLAYHFL